MSLRCFLVWSHRNTSSCDYNKVGLSWFDINHLNIHIGFWIQILQWVGVNDSSSLLFRNKLRALFNNVIKFFTICTIFCRDLTISRKISWLPTIITYDLASSSTKYSSWLLSLTSKIPTPPLRRVLLFLSILILLVLRLRLLLLLILRRLILRLCSF